MRDLINTDQAGHQPAYREWGLRPRVATTALQRALAVLGNEYLCGAQPRVAGERIREVKEEPERKLGRGTGADSVTRHPRPELKKAKDRNAPSAAAVVNAAVHGEVGEAQRCNG